MGEALTGEREKEEERERVRLGAVFSLLLLLRGVVRKEQEGRC